MTAGILGVAGDLLSIAFLCFILALALQLYCALKRQTRPPPPTPLPSCTLTTPPPHVQLTAPPSSCNKLYLFRFQRSTSCPVFSAVAPPISPPEKLATACHVSPVACAFGSQQANSTAALAKLMLSAAPAEEHIELTTKEVEVDDVDATACHVSPVACAFGSGQQANSTAALAKLMLSAAPEEHIELTTKEVEVVDDVDAENFICVPPPARLLFTIREEGKDEVDVASANENVMEESSSVAAAAACHVNKVGRTKKGGDATCSGAGLVSSASSDGVWSSSPSSSYMSASSSPFSPPRSSFWGGSSTLISSSTTAKARLSH